jgi:hypothetical protein
MKACDVCQQRDQVRTFFSAAKTVRLCYTCRKLAQMNHLLEPLMHKPTRLLRIHEARQYWNTVKSNA